LAYFHSSEKIDRDWIKFLKLRRFGDVFSEIVASRTSDLSEVIGLNNVIHMTLGSDTIKTFKSSSQKSLDLGGFISPGPTPEK
jgi:hypothetical protein